MAVLAKHPSPQPVAAQFDALRREVEGLRHEVNILRARINMIEFGESAPGEADTNGEPANEGAPADG